MQPFIAPQASYTIPFSAADIGVAAGRGVVKLDVTHLREVKRGEEEKRSNLGRANGWDLMHRI